MISFTDPNFRTDNDNVFSKLAEEQDIRGICEYTIINLKLILAEHREAKYTRKAAEQAEKRKLLVLRRSVKVITTLTFKFN